MKILLTLIMCSYTASTCLQPYPWPDTFSNNYDCMIAGYEESIKKAKEIGPEEINKYGTIIKFYCLQEKGTET